MRGKPFGAVERNDVAMPMRAQALHQRVAVGAFDRRFAGRIDMRDDDRVGIVEAGAELLEQSRQPRVAMRLHDGDHLALGQFARRLQHRRDLDRMVAIIVDNGDAVPHAGAGEAPPHAAETAPALADHVIVDAEFMRNRDRRRGIERVVAARHRQRDILDLVHELAGAVAKHDGEQRGAAGMRDIDAAAHRPADFRRR